MTGRPTQTLGFAKVSAKRLHGAERIEATQFPSNEAPSTAPAIASQLPPGIARSTPNANVAAFVDASGPGLHRA
ncbi:MAG: hypothetical protein HYY84_12755 [Deltaproteobacteria bacterium]|nr:hypothetical protein [Deltaproteobacteria bacterium]